MTYGSPDTLFPDGVPLQAASVDIWEHKYRLKRRDGSPIDRSVGETLERVARTLSAVEDDARRDHWTTEFLWALENGAVPAGRILANAGAQSHKPATSTINCTVSGTIHDSMDDILTKLHEAGMTLKRGSGIGYEFSTLRPKGAWVSGAEAYTSGPLSFMDVFDSMCQTVSSAGGRRGAQMATFDVGHPDVLAFIDAKRTAGRFRHFNLSLLITEAFVEAVRNDSPWVLAFPLTPAEQQSSGIDLHDENQVVWRSWPVSEGYVLNDRGQVACRVYRRLAARSLWDTIMRATYDYAEPGFILIDRVNAMNNNWFCEEIRATNPCGEQPLPPYGACLLGSVNLTRLVSNPFTNRARFDWDRFRRVVNVFTRMLDNVVEIHGLALPRQAAEIRRKRRHGMGFLGLGSALTMLTLRYGSVEAVAFTESVTRELALTGWQAALELAREKGPAPIMTETFTVTTDMLHRAPALREHGHKAGDELSGARLFSLGRYMRQLRELDPDLVDALGTTGARFTHHSSIAPTGTIALSLGNNASNGIEPTFAHRYVRNLVREGRRSREKVDVCSYELLAYRQFVDPGAEPGSSSHPLPPYFVTTDDITPIEHVDMQAAAQKWIDSSISKTANVPSDYPYESFKDIYLYACERGLKGCTTFRYNPARFQGVMVREDDLERTLYRFTLADGSTVELRGDEEVDYQGERLTAANLYDAINEGVFGRTGDGSKDR